MMLRDVDCTLLIGDPKAKAIYVPAIVPTLIRSMSDVDAGAVDDSRRAMFDHACHARRRWPGTARRRLRSVATGASTRSSAARRRIRRAVAGRRGALTAASEALSGLLKHVGRFHAAVVRVPAIRSRNVSAVSVPRRLPRTPRFGIRDTM